ncbi:flagellar protein FlaG [Alloalcanivorax profundimaris]|uniref:flagellar protein FlaG n=1 Tax=Alloalcanivorax profundimaris TaxID=2735259 RepID=UPI001888CFAF|nr:flagellar protein FlaG [Alloalcanivorax profundimaris]MBF1800819.1 flagellar protein FlaG [Alloalcanivorax profundimaris]
MSYPIDGSASSPQASQFSYLAARQRVEKVLQQLAVRPDADQTSAAEARALSQNELVKPVQQINEVLRRYGVQFDISDDSGRTLIRLVDRDTGELIRQIPPEEALNAAQRLDEIKGLLLSDVG